MVKTATTHPPTPFDSFSDWHRLGKHRGRPNKTLKRMAVDLLSQFKINQVADDLGVLPATLRSWKKSYQALDNPTATFVCLPHEEIKLSTANFRLNLPSGLELVVSDQPLEQVIQLITALVKEFSSCSI